MMVLALKVGRKGYGIGRGNNVKLTSLEMLCFFYLKKKVLRQIGQNVNICPFSLVSIFSLEILNIPFLN